ncbi:hypothetical protein HID58_014034 [Brassica napus]|uniref:Uncharacterized protein n=1 Tax=Brassica napus TaxID=3708 RepID=A0ABQ8DG36_BRANA|nr:hypothetical protein HID58_014034 [Brassica napus]
MRASDMLRYPDPVLDLHIRFKATKWLNPWKLPGSASALCPPLSAAGEPPPPLSLPPDPPDPSTPLSPHEYPPLSSSPPSKSRSKTGQNPNLKVGSRPSSLPAPGDSFST